MPEKWGKPCRISAVRCPHCGKFNDCTEFDYAIESMFGDPKQQLDIACDHCNDNFRIVKVERPILVYARPIDGDKVRGFENVQTEEERVAFEQTPEYQDWLRKGPRE